MTSISNGTSLNDIAINKINGDIFFNPGSELYFQLEALEDIEQWRKCVLSRIRKKAAFKEIQNMEEAWDRYCYTGDFIELFNKISAVISDCIKHYLDGWRSCGLSDSDFEGEFWERVWKIIAAYDGTGDFFLYETIIQAIYSRGKDIVKRAVKRQKTFSVWKQFYDETICDQTDIDKDITDKLLVDQLMSEWKLTTPEREFLDALYLNPGISFENIRKLMGLNHKETARRMLNRIKEKVVHYPDVETAFWGKPWNTKEYSNIYLLPLSKKKNNILEQKPEIAANDEIEVEVSLYEDICEDISEGIYTEEKPYA